MAAKKVNAGWETIPAISLSTGSTSNTELKWLGDNGAELTLLVRSDNDVYIEFAPDDTDLISSSSHILEANELYEIDVPWGLAAEETKNIVNLQLQRVNAVTTTVKVTKG